MTLDITLSAIFLALTFLGWRSGLLRQAIRIAALGAVLVAGPLVATVIREAWFQEQHVGAPLTEATSLFLAGVAIYFGFALAGWLAIRVMRATSKTASTMDRTGGALVGGLKGATVVYLLVFVGLLVQTPLVTVDPDDRLRLRDGEAIRFVQENNLLAPWHVPELEVFHNLEVVGADAAQLGLQAQIRGDAVAADVLRHETIRELTSDSQLAAAARDGHYHVTLADERVRALLANDELWARVEAVNWEDLRQVVEAKRSGETPKEGFLGALGLEGIEVKTLGTTFALPE